MKKAWLAILCAVAPVCGLGEPCSAVMARFAAADTRPDPVTLTRKTYRELLLRVGRDRIDAELLKVMAESDDPFTVPERAGADLLALNRRLKELQQLLKVRGWDTEPIRAALKEELRALPAVMAETRAEVERAGERTAGDYDLDLPPQAATAVSPDGRWIVGIDTKASLVDTYYVHDRDARRTIAYPIERQPLARPYFSPDGREIIFPNHTAQMIRVPFQNGQADFSRSVTVGSQLGTMHSLAKIHFGSSPGVVFCGRKTEILATDKDPKIHRFDFRTGERTALKLREFNPELLVADWGGVSGTDEIWVIESVDPISYQTSSPEWRIHFFNTAKDGTLTRSRMPRHWIGQQPRAVFWLGDNKTMILQEAGELRVWPEGSSRATTLYPTVLLGGALDFVASAAMTPARDRLAFLVEPQEGPAELKWLDLSSLEVKPGFTLGGNYREASFLPESRGLMAKGQNGEWRLFNHELRE